MHHMVDYGQSKDLKRPYNSQRWKRRGVAISAILPSTTDLAVLTAAHKDDKTIGLKVRDILLPANGGGSNLNEGQQDVREGRKEVEEVFAGVR